MLFKVPFKKSVMLGVEVLAAVDCPFMGHKELPGSTTGFGVGNIDKVSFRISKVINYENHQIN